MTASLSSLTVPVELLCDLCFLFRAVWQEFSSDEKVLDEDSEVVSDVVDSDFGLSDDGSDFWFVVDTLGVLWRGFFFDSLGDFPGELDESDSRKSVSL
jgi:hypothetical protein